MHVALVVFLSLVALFFLCVMWSIATYNHFVHCKALLDEGWSGVMVQLKRRYDLIPNLVSVVKGYSLHEKSALEEVIRMRSAAMNVANVHEKSIAESRFTRSLQALFAVAESYPNLKANEHFLSLQKELSLIEHEIQLARRYYNGAVRNYNVAIAQLPARCVAAFGGFSAASYFELSANEHEVPTVHF